jgi:hypothetical protein
MLRAAFLVAAFAAALFVPPSMGQTTCLPAVLAFGANAYLAETIPASVAVQQGQQLGTGELDAPIGEEGGRCERKRGSANVVALRGIDPLVAVGVEGRANEALILGAKCIGFAGDERWDCLRTPLAYDGRLYIAARYPAGTMRPLELGEALGPGKLGTDDVEVVAFDGIQPEAAVGLSGSPETAYVAIGVCQYGRFGETVLEDNLRRCLEAPFWLYFDPPGGEPEDTIVARADRPLPAEVSSARISLAQSRVNADVIPEGAAQTPIGAVTRTPDGGTLTFELPELSEGRYEAVLDCDGCTGKTAFPAGSLVILEGGGGGVNWGVVIMILIAVGFVGLLIVAIIIRRRGWTRGGRAGGPPGDAPGSEEPIR